MGRWSGSFIAATPCSCGIADGTCEVITDHWGLLDRYTVERDGFSVRVDSQDILRRWWKIEGACMAAWIAWLVFATARVAPAVGDQWLAAIVGLG